jgi:hypothetical protein
LFWEWGKFSLNFKIDIGKVDLSMQSEYAICNYQVSLRDEGDNLVAVVTGPEKFQYIKVQKDFAGLYDKFERVQSIDYEGKEDDLETIAGNAGASRNITCHIWTKDESLACCTDLGDILIFDYLGKLK